MGLFLRHQQLLLPGGQTSPWWVSSWQTRQVSRFSCRLVFAVRELHLQRRRACPLLSSPRRVPAPRSCRDGDAARAHRPGTRPGTARTARRGPGAHPRPSLKAQPRPASSSRTREGRGVRNPSRSSFPSLAPGSDGRARRAQPRPGPPRGGRCSGRAVQGHPTRGTSCPGLGEPGSGCPRAGREGSGRPTARREGSGHPTAGRAGLRPPHSLESWDPAIPATGERDSAIPQPGERDPAVPGPGEPDPSIPRGSIPPVPSAPLRLARGSSVLSCSPCLASALLEETPGFSG